MVQEQTIGDVMVYRVPLEDRIPSNNSEASPVVVNDEPIDKEIVIDDDPMATTEKIATTLTHSIA